MRKGETGQAFILVLILLAIGALIIVPALKLTGTSLKSSQIISRHVRAMYAADGAQEYVLWKLKYDTGYASSLKEGEPDNFPVDICGRSVNVTIVMRAVPGAGGLILHGDDVIQPTKTVDPDTIPNDWEGTVTYTIRLEQLSDNTSQGLDVIYDILPKTFDETDFIGNCRLKVDGIDRGDFPDPLIETGGEHAWGGQIRLRWPNPEIYPFSDNFTTDSVFKGIRDFSVRQVKELSFEMTHKFSGLDKDSTHCNWVVLKPWKTLSGPQAPIVVGGANPQKCNSEEGLIAVSKSSDPEIIQPFEKQFILYTINLINNDGMTHAINSVTDYLPPGFSYDNVTSPLPFGTIFEGRTEVNPDEPYEEELNGVLRQILHWDFATPVLNIGAGDNITLSFWATTTKDVSGFYFNEVVLDSDIKAPWIFVDDIGLTDEEFNSNYSWVTGWVIVPAYDSRTDADEIYIDANMALILEGISITSWQIY